MDEGGEGAIGVHEVIYQDKRRVISGVHAVPLTRPRAWLHRRGWDHQCLNDNRVRPQMLGRAIT